MEPLLQGANGMLLVDPLFQRVLAEACRARRIPVIFDEIFSGLWRLGSQSAWQRLGAAPDIACYAKLLTGVHPCLPGQLHHAPRMHASALSCVLSWASR